MGAILALRAHCGLLQCVRTVHYFENIVSTKAFKLTPKRLHQITQLCLVTPYLPCSQRNMQHGQRKVKGVDNTSNVCKQFEECLANYSTIATFIYLQCL